MIFHANEIYLLILSLTSLLAKPSTSFTNTMEGEPHF